MIKTPGRLLAAAVLALVLTPVSPAHAGDPNCNDRTDECAIVIVNPGSPADPKPDPDPAPKEKKVVPDCADLGGGAVAPVGSSLADLGMDDAAHAD
jgi:hypothetical protein